MTNSLGKGLHWLLSAGLPVSMGVLGLGALAVDLFGPFDLPNGYGDEIILAAASVVLLAYFGQHQIQAGYDRQHQSLLTRVETMLGRVEDRLDSVRQVPAGDIRQLLESHVNGASEYLFRGGSGRWLRKFTMPELSKATDRDVQLTIELLDPRDEDLCSAYAIYRGKALPKGHLRDHEDPRLIQRDILGSIYAAAWYGARRRLKSEVILLRTFSPLRYDISSQGLMVTVAEMTEPGLFAAKGTWLHASLVDELKQASHGHVAVVFPDVKVASYPVDLALLKAEDVRQVLLASRVVGMGGSAPLLSSFADVGGVDWQAIADGHVRE